MSDYTRRTFVGLAATGTSMLALGGAARALSSATASDLVRPPCGQDELSFLASCVKCDRCRSVCHAGIIAVATLEDGFLQTRTPKIDFHRGSCDFCGECQRVCALGALGSVGSFDPATNKLGVAVVQKDRCVAFQDSCTLCSQVCPYGAISLDSGIPIVDANICNGCGVCENACPALSYRSYLGGTRRGIVVVSPTHFERLGKTMVEDEEEMVA